jgi:hypothetical protein
MFDDQRFRKVNDLANFQARTPAFDDDKGLRAFGHMSVNGRPL